MESWRDRSGRGAFQIECLCFLKHAVHCKPLSLSPLCQPLPPKSTCIYFSLQCMFDQILEPHPVQVKESNSRLCENAFFIPFG